MVRNKGKTKNAFPPPRLNFIPDSLTSFPCRLACGVGDCDWYEQLLSAALSCSYFSSAPGWVPPTSCSSWRAAPALHHIPWGAVFQEQTAPVWAPLHGLQFLTGAWALHGLQLPSGLIHLLWPGVLYHLQVDICPDVVLDGLQGDKLFHHGLLHRLQGHFCSGARSTSYHSFLTDFCVCIQYSNLFLWVKLRIWSKFSLLLRSKQKHIDHTWSNNTSVCFLFYIETQESCLVSCSGNCNPFLLQLMG